MIEYNCKAKQGLINLVVMPAKKGGDKMKPPRQAGRPLSLKNGLKLSLKNKALRHRQKIFTTNNHYEWSKNQSCRICHVFNLHCHVKTYCCRGGCYHHSSYNVKHLILMNEEHYPSSLPCANRPGLPTSV